jgi:hypothetical protein
VASLAGLLAEDIRFPALTCRAFTYRRFAAEGICEYRHSSVLALASTKLGISVPDRSA